MNRHALLAFERNHWCGVVRHVERHFGQLFVAVILKIPSDILTHRQAGDERNGACRKPFAGDLCPVHKGPQQARHLGWSHFRPVNSDPVLGIAGPVGKVNRDGVAQQIRLTAHGNAGWLRNGERQTGQLLIAVILENPCHIAARRQRVLEHDRPICEPLPCCIGAVDVRPRWRCNRAGDHVRPINADPVLGIARTLGESDLDRFAHRVNLAAGDQSHRRGSLCGDTGREIPVTIDRSLQLPIRRSFRPGVEPECIGADTLGRLVVLNQADFADVGETGKFNCPCHRGD